MANQWQQYILKSLTWESVVSKSENNVFKKDGDNL